MRVRTEQRQHRGVVIPEVLLLRNSADPRNLLRVEVAFHHPQPGP
jgi:hypothetical protein